MTPKDSKERDIFGPLIVVAMMVCAFGAAVSSQRKHEEAHSNMQAPAKVELTATPDSVCRVIFKNTKEAPSLSDLETRYEGTSLLLYDSVYTAIRNAWLNSSDTVSFGQFISQYYYANNSGSGHPWLLWYESHLDTQN